ncbi:MAG: UvrD-helicase domain-containing protein, partial [Desulfobacterales bacterium]|nr:UvrD-helicase domain-containing protein [Desulfobacterales bacterium]
NISFWPATTQKHEGLCPVCSKPLTLGVLHRVEELADHKEGRKPSRHFPYHNIIQLADILAEVMQVGPKSKKVTGAYQTTLEKLGSEFNVLHYLDTDAIEQAGIPLLAEAVRRMRHQEIDVIPGFDGQYGRVQIFKNDERASLMGQQSLFAPGSLAEVASETIEKAAFRKPPPKKPAAIKDENLKPVSPQNPFEQLNDQQQQAVAHPFGPLLIVAGPGTGKTRTLTMRVAHLIQEKGISPAHILALTFTRKAAREMQQRLRAILGPQRQLPLTATFHSLCYTILCDQKPEQTIGIIDDDDRNKFIREAIKRVKKHGIEVSRSPQKLLARIIAAKQQIKGPAKIIAADEVTLADRALAEVYHSYQALLSIQGLYDYEDLIFNVVQLLENDLAVCQAYRRRFQHIFVDEYQDLNHGQYRIVQALAPCDQSNQNLCVIGDPDQSIYGFRGADVGYFRRFVDDYPSTTVIELTRNYRSTETNLDASFQVIRDHRLHTSADRTTSQIKGIKTISILEMASGRAEARALARVIEQLVGGSGFHSIDTGRVMDANLESARSYADFAVLVRTHYQLNVIAEVFDQEGVPFQIASRKTRVKSWGMAELISLLSVVEGFGSDLDLDNCLSLYAAGLNPKTAEKFKSWCYSRKFSQQKGLINAKRFPVPGLSRDHQQKLIDFSEALSAIKDQTAGMTIAEKLQHLSQVPQLSNFVNTEPKSREAFNNLLSLSKEVNEDMSSFLATAALLSDTDAYLSRAEKVALMTLHAAKGLEFPVVFIAGCEDDFIPLKPQGNRKADLAEERRLFYVAMTRAMQQLFLTRAKKRSVYGKRLTRHPSPFLSDIEKHLKKDDSPQKKSHKKKNKKQRQLKLF